MPVQERRYSKEEFARRGTEIYETNLRNLLEPNQKGKYAAIDIETGVYEVADDLLTAGKRVLAHRPDAQVWYVRIGYPAVCRIGYSPILPG